MSRKFYSYERFSHGSQVAGSTLDRQRQMIERAAKEEGLEIDSTLCIRDKACSAYRGRHSKKGELAVFLELAESGVIPKGSVLCIERVDRLGRMPWRQQVALWERILACGIIIRTCEPATRYTAENADDIDIGCPLVIAMMLAHQESRQKSERIKDAAQRKRNRAIAEGVPHGMRCPGWLRPIGKPHPDDANRQIVERWETIDDRVRTIRKMHEWCREGMGVRLIMKQLETLKIPYWGKRGRWTRMSVIYHLTSRALVGEVVSKGVNYKCGRPAGSWYLNYPPIMTEEEYERTQSATAQRKRRGGRPVERGCNLFCHLLATEDGTRLTLNHCFGKNGKRYPYLTTDRRNWMIPYGLFEETVLASLRKLKPSDIDGSCKKDDWLEQIKELQAVASMKRLAMENLERQLDELDANRWPQRIVERVSILEAEIHAAEIKLRQAKEAGSTSTRVETLVSTQSIVEYLGGLNDPAEVSAAKLRIKQKLPIILERITVAVEIEKNRSKWIHVRIAYQGGHVDRVSLMMGKPARPNKRYTGLW